ncbi:MAG: hypothetical protein VXA18_03910, partial [Gammaproteobacteria bacterium]
AKTTYPVFFMSSSKAVKYSGTLIIPDSLEKIALSHFISSSRKLTSSFESIFNGTPLEFPFLYNDSS